MRPLLFFLTLAIGVTLQCEACFAYQAISLKRDQNPGVNGAFATVGIESDATSGDPGPTHSTAKDISLYPEGGVASVTANATALPAPGGTAPICVLNNKTALAVRPGFLPFEDRLIQANFPRANAAANNTGTIPFLVQGNDPNANGFTTIGILLFGQISPAGPNALVGTVGRGDLIAGEAQVKVRVSGRNYIISGLLPDSSVDKPFPEEPRLVSDKMPLSDKSAIFYFTTQRVALNGRIGASVSSQASADTENCREILGFNCLELLDQHVGVGSNFSAMLGGVGPIIDFLPLPDVAPFSSGLGSAAGADGPGDGDAIGLSSFDGRPMQASVALEFVSANYAKDLEGFTPRIVILKEGQVVADVAFGDEGTTYDPTTGEATFDLRSLPQFDPGVYTVGFSENYSRWIYVAFPGDVNLDGLVDAGDVEIVQANLETPELFTNAFRTDGDINGDGAVTEADLALLQELILLQQTAEPEVLLADVNRDGTVNVLDINPFLVVLTSGAYQVEADVNQDGIVNVLDINPFIMALFSN